MSKQWNVKYPIVVDGNKIFLNDREICPVDLFLGGDRQNWRIFKLAGLEHERPDSGPNGYKERNQKACELFGPKAFERLKKLMMAALYRKYGPEVLPFFYNFHAKKINPYQLCDIENCPHIEQAIKDNAIATIPALVRHKVPPKECKGILGKHYWKKLCSQPKSRTILINKVAPLEDRWWRLLDLRTTTLQMLKGHGLCGWHRIDELINTFLAAERICTVISRDLHDCRILVYDTCRMLDQLDEKPNFKWSKRRWEEEHNRASRALLTQEYSPEPFCQPWAFKKDGYCATLLTSQLDIAEEGQEMKHCVASYAGDCEDGEYAVFKIEGKERLTLGVNIDIAPISLHQMYGPCHAPASEDARTFAYELIDNFYDFLLPRQVNPCIN